MMSAYVRVPFGKAVRDATGGNPKVKRRDYLPDGPLPVMDQGQDYIAGYTTKDNAYAGQLPVVLFGDHTRIFKYVDFPFALGADGVKVLVPLEGFDALFLYYYFRNINLPAQGYSRHFKFLRELSVYKPSLDEQQRIVGILNRAAKIERLRKQAQQLMQEFIPALFVKIFGDPAENPMGWPCGTLQELCMVDRQGLDPNSSVTSQLPFLGVENVESHTGAIDLDKDSRSVSQKSATFQFDERHVLYAKLRPYLNKVATPDFTGRCSTELIPLLPRKGVNRDFVAQLLRRQETVEYAMASVTGSRMPRTDMKSLMLLPVLCPPFNEQARFGTFVKAEQNVVSRAKSAHQSISSLNNSLMSHLLEEAA